VSSGFFSGGIFCLGVWLGRLFLFCLYLLVLRIFFLLVWAVGVLVFWRKKGLFYPVVGGILWRGFFV